MTENRFPCPIHELPESVLMMAHGYAKGDPIKMNAVLRVRFHGESTQIVASELDQPESTVRGWCKGFAELIEKWNDRKQAVSAA